MVPLHCDLKHIKVVVELIIIILDIMQEVLEDLDIMVAVEECVATVGVAVEASDVIPNPDHFGIAFVFAYNRG